MNKCPACGAINDGENDEELTFSLCDECKNKGGVHLIEYTEVTEADEFNISGRIIWLSKDEFLRYFNNLECEMQERILSEAAMLVSAELFNVFLDKFHWKERLN
jgi:hypothetical protein